MKNNHEFARHGKTIVTTLALFFTASIAFHWGWNTFAVEILEQTRITFKHAFGLQALLFSLALSCLSLWLAFKGAGNRGNTDVS